MNPIRLLLADAETQTIMANWRIGETTRERFMIFGAIGLVTALVVLWAVFLRKKRRRRRSHHHEHHGSSVPAQVPGASKDASGPAPEFHARPVGERARGPKRLPGVVDIRQRFRFNPTLRDRDFFLASLAGMVLTNVCFGATSIGLVGEKENGTYEQILASPISATEVVSSGRFSLTSSSRTLC